MTSNKLRFDWSLLPDHYWCTGVCPDPDCLDAVQHGCEHGLDEPHFRVRLLGPRILAQRLPLPEVVPSGLYLLGREYPTLAVVAALGTGWRYGYRKDRTYFKGKGGLLWSWADAHGLDGVPLILPGEYIPIVEVEVGDMVQFARGEFQKWQIAEDWAIMPLESCDLVVKELEESPEGELERGDK